MLEKFLKNEKPENSRFHLFNYDIWSWNCWWSWKCKFFVYRVLNKTDVEPPPLTNLPLWNHYINYHFLKHLTELIKRTNSMWVLYDSQNLFEMVGKWSKRDKLDSEGSNFYLTPCNKHNWRSSILHLTWNWYWYLLNREWLICSNSYVS